MFMTLICARLRLGERLVALFAKVPGQLLEHVLEHRVHVVGK
jgi:hypothetical protein